MAQLRQDYQKFVDANAVVVVVGPDKPEKFKKYWKENDLPFIGLSDPKHTVLKLYGQEVNLFKLGRMPAMVLIDKTGRARFVHYGHDMTDIPDNMQVLEVIDGL